MAKKKKSHGGLKFLAFLVVVGALITSIVTGSKTEFGQRVLGHREDRRVERTRLTPRFAFSAAKLRVTVGAIYNQDGSTIDLTTTRETSLDRESSTVSTDISVERTATEVAPGVSAIPFDPLNAKYTEIVNKLYRYESPKDPGESWTRSTVDPYYYGTELDDHFIPMIDDIMGFELKALPTKAIAANVASGFRRPAANTLTPPPAATKSYSYEMDMQTYRRVAPILAKRTIIDEPPDTALTLTVAFDAVGLLRFADVAIPISAATSLAQQRGTARSAAYHYTFEVTDILSEPIAIDLPTDVVDEDPAVIRPVTVI